MKPSSPKDKSIRFLQYHCFEISDHVEVIEYELTEASDKKLYDVTNLAEINGRLTKACKDALKELDQCEE